MSLLLTQNQKGNWMKKTTVEITTDLNVDAPVLTVIDGIALVSSLHVEEVFEKEHKTSFAIFKKS